MGKDDPQSELDNILKYSVLNLVCITSCLAVFFILGNDVILLLNHINSTIHINKNC